MEERKEDVLKNLKKISAIMSDEINPLIEKVKETKKLTNSISKKISAKEKKIK